MPTFKPLFKTVFIFLFSIFLLGTKATAESVVINESSFPDPAFRAFVSAYIDQNADGHLSDAEINDAETLDSDLFPAAKNIDGASIFKNISSIFLIHDSQITELDVSSFKRLKRISISRTPLTKLQFGEHPELKEILIHTNSALPFTLPRAQNLEKLFLYPSHLSAFDSADFPKLEEFAFGGSSLSELNIPDSTKIKRIQLAFSPNLHKISLGKLPNLKHFTLREVPISSLDLRQSKNLRELGLIKSAPHSIFLADNVMLSEVDMEEIKLAWIEWKNTGALLFHGVSSPSALVSGTSFDISKTFPGIDPSKIEVFANGSRNGSMITVDDIHQPVKYRYLVGNVNGAPFRLEVHLTLQLVSAPHIPVPAGSDPSDIPHPANYVLLTILPGEGTLAAGTARAFWVNPAVPANLPLLPPTPKPGFVFDGWSHDISGVFIADTQITPRFKPKKPQKPAPQTGDAVYSFVMLGSAAAGAFFLSLPFGRRKKEQA